MFNHPLDTEMTSSHHKLVQHPYTCYRSRTSDRHLTSSCGRRKVTTRSQTWYASFVLISMLGIEYTLEGRHTTAGASSHRRLTSIPLDFFRSSSIIPEAPHRKHMSWCFGVQTNRLHIPSSSHQKGIPPSVYERLAKGTSPQPPFRH